MSHNYSYVILLRQEINRHPEIYYYFKFLTYILTYFCILRSKFLMHIRRASELMTNRCLMKCRCQFKAFVYIRDLRENEDEAKIPDKHEVAQNCREV
jgi:hypothetical protein